MNDNDQEDLISPHEDVAQVRYCKWDQHEFKESGEPLFFVVWAFTEIGATSGARSRVEYYISGVLVEDYFCSVVWDVIESVFAVFLRVIKVD